MNEQFIFDVFLNHSSKDKNVVRAIAERLRADGLRVWLRKTSKENCSFMCDKWTQSSSLDEFGAVRQC